MAKNMHTTQMDARFLWIAAAALVAIAGVLAWSSSRQVANQGGKIKIVAAENFWGDIAKQIGGDRTTVTSIITDPSADPHLYESNAKNAAAIGAADIAIENGLGYDDFFDKLLAASKSDRRAVIVASTVLTAPDGANPHLWYDIPRVHLVADQIEAALAREDPSNKASYEANLAKFTQSLQPLLDKVGQIKRLYPGAPVAYTEPVPRYLLDDAGLSTKTPERFAIAIEEGEDPSPADSSSMYNLMTNHGVKVLFYNSQATSPVTQHVRDLATQSGIPVVGVSETLPADSRDYQSWQLDQLNSILKALGTK